MVYLLSMVSSMALMKRCALLCLLAFWAVSAEAATYYVRTGGSDSHSCGQAQTDNNSNAKGSIQGGINCVTGPGDFVVVHGGNYSGGGPGGNCDGNESWRTCLRNNGNSSTPITIRAATGETVWHNNYFTFANGSAHGEYWVIDGININCGYGSRGAIGCLQTASHVTVKNLEVMNGYYIGILMNSDNHMINVRSHGHGQQSGTLCLGGEADGQCHGFYFHESPQLIENCEVYNNRGWGVSADYDTLAAGVVIRNNKIHQSKGGFQIINMSTPFRVYNNLVYDTQDDSLGIWIQGTSGAEIYNNTIVNNHSGGITTPFGSSGPENNAQIRNNIFYNNGNNIDITGSGNTFSNNLCNSTGSGCTNTGNPQFANAPGGDFHLTSQSTAAIDQGTNLSSVFTTDIESNAHGSAWDIGAYEYTDSAPRPLSAPTDFRRAGQ